MSKTTGSRQGRHSKHKKLPVLPPDARVSKRPLLRPQIPSPYTSSSQTKVVYVSTKTPFMSAVKRIEKLFKASEKRAIQTATARSKKRPRRQGSRGGIDDVGEIEAIVEELQSGSEKEDVVVKGSGKAISKALQIAVWFQQREQYSVKLTTATAAAIDDVEMPEGDALDEKDAMEDVERIPETEIPASLEIDGLAKDKPLLEDHTRIRQLSVIEVHIAMK